MFKKVLGISHGDWEIKKYVSDLNIFYYSR